MWYPEVVIQQIHSQIAVSRLHTPTTSFPLFWSLLCLKLWLALSLVVLDFITPNPTLPDRELTPGCAEFSWYLNSLLSAVCSIGLLGYLDGSVKPPRLRMVLSRKKDADGNPTYKPSPEPTAAMPVNSTNPSILEFELCDGHVAGAIYQNIVNLAGYNLTPMLTSCEMYILLRKWFLTQSKTAKRIACQCLTSAKYAEETHMENHITYMQGLYQEALLAGCNITEIEFKSLILASLPKSMCASVQIYQDKDLNSIKSGLIEDYMEDHADDLSTPLQASDMTALFVRGAATHCTNCQQPYHSAKKGWAHGGGAEGDAPNWWIPPSGLEPHGWKPKSNASSSNSTATAAVATVATAIQPIETYNLTGVDNTLEDYDQKLLPF